MYIYLPKIVGHRTSFCESHTLIYIFYVIDKWICNYENFPYICICSYFHITLSQLLWILTKWVLFVRMWQYAFCMVFHGDRFFSPLVSIPPKSLVTRVGFWDKWWEIHLTWKTIQNAFSRILYTSRHVSHTKYTAQSWRTWKPCEMDLSHNCSLHVSQKYARTFLLITCMSLIVGVLDRASWDILHSCGIPSGGIPSGGIPTNRISYTRAVRLSFWLSSGSA